MLLMVPTAGTNASIVSNLAPRFLTASFTLRPVIGLVSVMFVPTSNRASAATMSSKVTVQRRSEEHTSELQSRGHLVCRLLLEKKKKSRNRGLALREDLARAASRSALTN